MVREKSEFYCVSSGIWFQIIHTFIRQNISLKRYTAQIKYKSYFIICQLSIIVSIFHIVIGWNILHFYKFYCMVVRQQAMKICCEHSHHLSEKVGTIRNELFKLWISMMCKLCECLHIDTNPWFIHKNKIHSCSYMEVWALQNLDLNACFHWSRSLKTNESVSEIL